jgi:hypothetical protein
MLSHVARGLFIVSNNDISEEKFVKDKKFFYSLQLVSYRYY